MGRNTFRGILGPCLFNIFLCDLFFSMNERDFASCVDDNTPYVTGDRMKDVINELENDSIKPFKWFVDNQIKAKKDKYHLLISGSENFTINLDGNIIGKSICENLLGLKVDYKLKFTEHLESILKKAGRNVNAFLRVLPYKNFEKKTHIHELPFYVTVVFTLLLPFSMDVSQP